MVKNSAVFTLITDRPSTNAGWIPSATAGSGYAVIDGSGTQYLDLFNTFDTGSTQVMPREWPSQLLGWSFGFWFRWNGAAGTKSTRLFTCSSVLNSATEEVWFGFDSHVTTFANNANLKLGYSGCSFTFPVGGSMVSGVWFYVGFSMESTGLIRFFINGAQVSTHAGCTTLPKTIPRDFCSIGRNAATGQISDLPFNMASFMFWQRSLAPSG